MPSRQEGEVPREQKQHRLHDPQTTGAEGKEGTHFSTTEKVLSSILDALIVDYVDAKESQFKDRMDVAYGNILDNASELFSVKEAREEAAAGKIDVEDANAVGTDPDSEKAEAAEKDLEVGDAHATAERE